MIITEPLNPEVLTPIIIEESAGGLDLTVTLILALTSALGVLSFYGLRLEKGLYRV